MRNKNSVFKSDSQNSFSSSCRLHANNFFFCNMTRKNRRQPVFFENREVIDAGAEGVCVARAPDGKTALIPNVVLCEGADVQTTIRNKAYYEARDTNLKEDPTYRTDP